MKIYTDGSSWLGDNSGGFAIVVCDNNDEVLYTISKRYKNTRFTNNMGELVSILIAVLLYGRNEEPVKIYSDSAYAINTLEVWSNGWRRNGWVKGDGKEPENLRIIMQYHALKDQGYRAELIKVKGHSTCRGNILADKIARGEKEATIQL